MDAMARWPMPVMPARRRPTAQPRSLHRPTCPYQSRPQHPHLASSTHKAGTNSASRPCKPPSRAPESLDRPWTRTPAPSSKGPYPPREASTKAHKTAIYRPHKTSTARGQSPVVSPARACSTRPRRPPSHRRPGCPHTPPLGMLASPRTTGGTQSPSHQDTGPSLQSQMLAPSPWSPR